MPPNAEDETENWPSGRLVAEGKSISPGMPNEFSEIVSSNSLAAIFCVKGKLKIKADKHVKTKHLIKHILFDPRFILFFSKTLSHLESQIFLFYCDS